MNNETKAALYDFVSTVDDTGIEHVLTELDWPDLIVAYIDALKALGRRDEADAAQAKYNEIMYGGNP